MSIIFSSQVLQPPTFAPTLTMAENRRVVVVDTVVRRRCSDVVEEMARIAKGERKRMTAQMEEAAEFAKQEKERMTAQAPPTPLYPGRFREGRRRSTRQPINPAPPETFQVAAMTTSWESDEREQYLLRAAEEAARRPRTPTPPRRPDDHYDLARWSVQRWK